MTNRTHAGLLVVVCAAALIGCDDARPTSPTATPASRPQQTPRPPSSVPGDAIEDVSLSGVVFEVTPAGRVPIEGARVFLSDDQDVLTDANGFFSFRPVWVCPCAYHPLVDAGVTVISVSKDGYGDPAWRPAVPGFNGSSWLTVAIDGDTRSDIDLVRQ
jgi:hypothetical protein